jgi:hypothetical protein
MCKFSDWQFRRAPRHDQRRRGWRRVTPAFVPVARNAGLNVIFDLSTIKNRFANIGLMTREKTIREQPRLSNDGGRPGPWNQILED